MQYLSFSDLVNSIQGVMQYLAAVAIIPSLMICLWGYKLQKAMITISGVLTGGILGAALGLLTRNLAVIIISAVAIAFVGGLLAFKVYLLGVFIHHFTLGALLGAAILIVVDAVEMLPIAFVIGIFTGVLSIVLNRVFIIILTAVSGGLVSGIALGLALFEGEPLVGIIIGMILAGTGLMVQGTTTGPNHKNKELATAGKQRKISKRAAISVTDDKFTPKGIRELLDVTCYESYCPKASMAVKNIQLYKDSYGNISCDVDLKYFGEEKLIAVKYKIVGYDIGGDPMGEFEVNLLDQNISSGDIISIKEFAIGNSLVRRAGIVILQTVNASFEVTKYEDKDSVQVPASTTIEAALGSELTSVLDLNNDEIYTYQSLEDGFWKCTCSTINKKDYCYQCGRSTEDSLRPDKAYERVALRIADKKVQVASCNKISKINDIRTSIEKILTVLTLKNEHEDLQNECKSILDMLQTKESELVDIEVKHKAEHKAKTKKAVIISVIALIGLVLIAGVGVFVLSRKPSEARARRDATKYCRENFGEKCSVNVESITSEPDHLWYSADVEVINECDRIQSNLSIHYNKHDIQYKLSTVREVTTNYFPAHTDYTNDEFEAADMVDLVLGDESVRVYDASSYDGIDYENIVIDGQIAIVPLIYEQSFFDGSVVSMPNQTVPVRYTYQGNGKWSSYDDVSIEVMVVDEPEEITVDLVKRLIADAYIETYNGIRVGTEFLNLDTINIYYDDFRTRANLNGFAVWNDSHYSFICDYEFVMVFRQGQWRMESCDLYQNYDEKQILPNDELLADMLPSVITANCKNHGDVRDITILDKAIAYNGYVDVSVSYISSDSDNAKIVYMHTASLRFLDTFGEHNLSFSSLNSETCSVKVVEAIEKDVIAPYSVVCHGSTVPLNMNASDIASLNVKADTNNLVYIIGYVGTVPLNLVGILSGEGNITISGTPSVNVYVEYTLIFKTNGNAAFTLTSNNLRFDGDSLTGTITAESNSLWLDDFSINFY